MLSFRRLAPGLIAPGLCVLALAAPHAAHAQSAAYDPQSAEIHASLQSELLEGSRHIREIMDARLRGTVVGPYDPIEIRGKSVWLQPYANWGRGVHTNDAYASDRDAKGILAGADKRLGNTWRFGLAGGYTRTGVDVDARHSHANIDSYQGDLYAGGQIGAISVRMGGGYAYHELRTRRSDLGLASDERARAKYHAATGHGFVEVGYVAPIGPFTVEPFLNAAYADVHIKGFKETGSSLDVAVRKDDQQEIISTLGGRGTYRFDPFAGHAITLFGSAGWRRAYGRITPSSRTTLVSTQEADAVWGSPIARNAAAVDAGAGVELGQGAAISAAYAGQLSHSAWDNAVRVTLTFKFL